MSSSTESPITLNICTQERSKEFPETDIPIINVANQSLISNQISENENTPIVEDVSKIHPDNEIIHQLSPLEVFKHVENHEIDLICKTTLKDYVDIEHTEKNALIVQEINDKEIIKTIETRVIEDSQEFDFICTIPGEKEINTFDEKYKETSLNMLHAKDNKEEALIVLHAIDNVKEKDLIVLHAEDNIKEKDLIVLHDEDNTKEKPLNMLHAKDSINNKPLNMLHAEDDSDKGKEVLTVPHVEVNDKRITKVKKIKDLSKLKKKNREKHNADSNKLKKKKKRKKSSSDKLEIVTKKRKLLDSTEERNFSKQKNTTNIESEIKGKKEISKEMLPIQLAKIENKKNISVNNKGPISRGPSLTSSNTVKSKFKISRKESLRLLLNEEPQLFSKFDMLIKVKADNSAKKGENTESIINTLPENSSCSEHLSKKTLNVSDSKTEDINKNILKIANVMERNVKSLKRSNKEDDDYSHKKCDFKDLQFKSSNLINKSPENLLEQEKQKKEEVAKGSLKKDFKHEEKYTESVNLQNNETNAPIGKNKVESTTAKSSISNMKNIDKSIHESNIPKLSNCSSKVKNPEKEFCNKSLAKLPNSLKELSSSIKSVESSKSKSSGTNSNNTSELSVKVISSKHKEHSEKTVKSAKPKLSDKNSKKIQSYSSQGSDAKNWSFSSEQEKKKKMEVSKESLKKDFKHEIKNTVAVKLKKIETVTPIGKDKMQYTTVKSSISKMKNIDKNAHACNRSLKSKSSDTNSSNTRELSVKVINSKHKGHSEKTDKTTKLKSSEKILEKTQSYSFQGSNATKGQNKHFIKEAKKEKSEHLSGKGQICLSQKKKPSDAVEEILKNCKSEKTLEKEELKTINDSDFISSISSSSNISKEKLSKSEEVPESSRKNKTKGRIKEKDFYKDSPKIVSSPPISSSSYALDLKSYNKAKFSSDENICEESSSDIESGSSSPIDSEFYKIFISSSSEFEGFEDSSEIKEKENASKMFNSESSDDSEASGSGSEESEENNECYDIFLYSNVSSDFEEIEAKLMTIKHASEEKNELSVSSVHTSDLSSFDDEISVDSSFATSHSIGKKRLKLKEAEKLIRTRALMKRNQDVIDTSEDESGDSCTSPVAKRRQFRRHKNASLMPVPSCSQMKNYEPQSNITEEELTVKIPIDRSGKFVKVRGDAAKMKLLETSNLNPSVLIDKIIPHNIKDDDKASLCKMKEMRKTKNKLDIKFKTSNSSNSVSVLDSASKKRKKEIAPKPSMNLSDSQDASNKIIRQKVSKPSIADINIQNKDFDVSPNFDDVSVIGHDFMKQNFTKKKIKKKLRLSDVLPRQKGNKEQKKIVHPRNLNSKSSSSQYSSQTTGSTVAESITMNKLTGSVDSLENIQVFELMLDEGVVEISTTPEETPKKLAKPNEEDIFWKPKMSPGKMISETVMDPIIAPELLNEKISEAEMDPNIAPDVLNEK